AGGGVRYSGAAAELASFARGFRVPVAETSAGKGIFQDEELLLGGIGVNGTRAANAIAHDADVVICVGTRLTDFTTGSHSLFQNPTVRFVGVNVTSRDAQKLAALPVLADAKVALAALEQRLRQHGWIVSEGFLREIAAVRESWQRAVAEDVRPRDGERMSQGQVLRVLNEASRPGDWVVAAAGSPPGDLLKLWDCASSAAAHLEFGYSCMGHEIPAALGIRLANRERGEVYVVVGDGGYLMNPSELLTAAQERLKITVLLVMNGGFQSIHTLQQAALGTSFGNEFRAR